MIKRFILSVSILLLGGMSLTSCESCPFGYSSDSYGDSCLCPIDTPCAGNCGCPCDICEE